MAQKNDDAGSQDNPHARLPLPDYAKKWHSTVYRPKRLPDVFDPRIDPAHIFAMPFNPDTEEQGEYFIVANRCTMCARVRNVCSRGDPACRRCAEKDLTCIPQGAGYVELPLPRLKKQPLRQEVQALKKSLPDAPYYRDHSASVAKTMATPAQSASAPLRKGKRSIEQGSVSPAQRKRRASQGQEKASASRRDSRKRASASPQPESPPAKVPEKRASPVPPAPEAPASPAPETPASPALEKSASPAPEKSAPPAPEKPTPEVDEPQVEHLPQKPPSSASGALSPTPTSTPSETRHPSVHTHPLSVTYVTASRPSSLSMVTNGAHTFVGTIPYQASASQSHGASGSPAPQPQHRQAAPSSATHTLSVYAATPPTSAATGQNGVFHSQPFRPTNTPESVSAAAKGPSPPARSAATARATTATSTLAVQTNNNVTSPRLSIRVPPRSSFHSTGGDSSTANAQKSNSAAAPKPASQAPRSYPVHSSQPSQARPPPPPPPAPSLPMRTIYDVLSAAMSQGMLPPGVVHGLPFPPGVPAQAPNAAPVSQSPAPAHATTVHTSPNAMPAYMPAVYVPPRPLTATVVPTAFSTPANAPSPAPAQPPAQNGQSISSAPSARSPAPVQDESCSFRLSTSAAWAPDGGASSDESSGDEPLARKRKQYDISTNDSASTRPPSKRHRPESTQDASNGDTRTQVPAPWWTAQASLNSGQTSWYSQANALDAPTTSSAPAPNGSTSHETSHDTTPNEAASMSATNGKRREEPFLSPLRPPLPSIQQRAERFAPLQDPPPSAQSAPEDEDDGDSEAEVALYLKPRPRRGPRSAHPSNVIVRPSPSDSPAPPPPPPVFVPRQKLLEDSAVVLVEDILLHLPRSRLVQMSEYFAKHLSRDNEDEQTSTSDQCPVVKVTGVSAEDLETLLGVCDDPSIFIQRQPPFKTLVAVFCTARTLRFRQIDALATSRLESLWPSDLHKLSPVRTPHAAETVAIARMYGLPAVLKRAFYELLRSEGFAQKGVAAAAADGTPADGSRLLGRAKLSHADLVRLVTTREKLQMAWTLLVGTAPSPAAFPCMLQQTTDANTAYSTHSARERCEEACRNSAQIWAEWVLDSGLYESWMYDPVCGLERLSVLDWENSGFCSACVMTRRQLWARKREEIWENLDAWLGLGA
ncbi:hypothetical protein PsYK624_067590 [Phanerochaete sordida]|uniref:Zn(2)-C6 fungal-type domain-containing protein n=1 Tax=Phanerochaete sordida TaxID=48140 RepID=A0A9P3GB17_9APHY|nr:hypothetical protein PsYK624_067590 [Phanerochaete sordida]